MSLTTALNEASRRRRLAVAATLLAAMAISVTALPAAASTGPYLVKNINTSGSSGPLFLTPVGETLFFTANDGVHGRELWKSDGTAAGTKLVREIEPGNEDVWNAPGALTAIGNLLYFNADDGVHGRELWVTDGTTTGTRMVYDVPGTWPSGSLRGLEPSGFTEFNGLVYFSGTDAVGGRELWRTDGTAAGTVRVADLTPGSGGSFPESLVVFKNKLYFLRSVNGYGLSTLYRTDGTASGTKAVRDRNGNKIKGAFQWRRLWAIGDRLYIGRNLKELWVSGGTPSTTGKLADFGTREMVDLNGTAYFAWYGHKVSQYPDSLLWTTDGTSNGTHPITFEDGTGIIWPDYSDGFLTSFANKLAFFGAGQAGLSVSDGTSAGTHSLGLDINPGGFDVPTASLDGVLYFACQTYDVPSDIWTPLALWRSDGTTAGTYSLTEPIASGVVESITPVGDSVFFVSQAGKGVELWRYVP